jgi:hypothetical protein
MRRFRVVSAAAVMASLIAVGTSSLEAKSKTGGDGQSATCQYLLSVINYSYVSPTIQAMAISLYNSLGCAAVP